MDYKNFITKKSHTSINTGFKPNYFHPMAYDFQNHLVEWAVNKGRAAIFADCGLGKTLMQLTWAQNVIEHTNKPVLILAPLSVTMQTVDEAEKFNFDCKRSTDGKVETKICLSNYERLHYFNPDDFSGIVCDESSILKNFDGSTKSAITDFMRKIPYRLLCTATASPNDYIELGTSSEALGHLGYMDMLSMFFKNDEKSLHPAFVGSKWRFKFHAEKAFWKWVCSWAKAVRKPSDLGFSDNDFILPPLNTNRHYLDSVPMPGNLFALPAITLQEQRIERKESIVSRCEKAAELMNHDDFGVMWCQMNAEGDFLTNLVKDSVQITGSDSDEYKEEIFEAFRKGQVKKLVTKPKIAAFGLNWQHCNHMTYFPDHSFEQYYQAVRRMWRFGQKREVIVDEIITESGAKMAENLSRKMEACDKMFSHIVAFMNEAQLISDIDNHSKKETLPSWL